MLKRERETTSVAKKGQSGEKKGQKVGIKRGERRGGEGGGGKKFVHSRTQLFT